ncbi:28S ribosomal protein S18a, mitochondrial [Pseudomyrmex gracilis]|uniref:28S ribosomal protein S18a, mitochondrial n=1 Tax=Pseudomyrmex gracilis TaxID=219809 RepID=UPI00099564B4|nr:28S ribosomal protein S18a, mitochondrial [Pseudomyrmex gracilis]
MSALCLFVKQSAKHLIFSKVSRGISLSATTRLKEIIEKKEGNTLTIEGVYISNEKEHLQLKTKSNACILCETGLDVKHTDVLILKQFMQLNGKILPRKVSGLCRTQHLRIKIMLNMAKEAGLIPVDIKDGDLKDPKQREKWRNYNTYYDENTIKFKYRN